MRTPGSGRQKGSNEKPRPAGEKACKICARVLSLAYFYPCGNTYAGKCKDCWLLPTPKKSMADRFWPNVQKSDGCWLWTGRGTKEGYGHFNLPSSRGAHRASWILAHGPIPDDMCVCHQCDTPRCVRPDHLFLGTKGDNTRDAAAKGRIWNGGQKGERNARAKLTWEKVTVVRQLIGEGLSYGAVGRAVGVSPGSIQAIAVGRTWREEVRNDPDAQR